MTGFSVADTLVELGAEVLVIAASASPERTMLLSVIGAELIERPDLDAPPTRLADFAPELVVVSPGYRPDHPLIEWAVSHDVPVWGDVELAWRVRDKVGAAADWITVTGTNGKTTTVQLAASMLAGAGLRVAPCGNIGVPVLDAVRDPQGFDVLVVELSSYQLHWINRNAGGELSPFSSVCLNVAEDHLDWHGSFEEYRNAKAKVYQNTRVACVYNRDDSTTENMVRDAEVVEGARAIGFGLSVPGPSDLGVIDGIVVDRAFLDDRLTRAIELTTLDELAAVGLAAPHVVSDVVAAAALARSRGVGADVIHDVLAAFALDAHRIEVVLDEAGIRWIDDSKATNPHAAAASLSAFPSVVWIVGGLLKGVDIDSLVRSNAARLRAAVIIGANRDAVRESFRRHAPLLPVYEVEAAESADVMPTAVGFARDIAQPGDTVLLAPAAASMDQFADYAERGRLFQSAVRDAATDGTNE